MGKLQIDILGTSFAINAAEDSEYLEKLLTYYTQIIKQLESKTQIREPIQTAILAGIMLCDELYQEKLAVLKEKKQFNTELLTKIERITTKMIDNIDKVL